MITVDVIKSAYRQTKDGYVVTFVIHPQDKHAALADAPIGSQFNMRLVPLDEDGNAEKEDEQKPAGQAAPVSRANRLTQQAAMCCKNPQFRAFLRENNMLANTSEEAAVAVRLICHVKSRTEFLPGTPAGIRWEELYGKFIAWRDHDVPDVAA